MKKDLITEKSGRIGIIIKAALLFFAVSAAAVILFALVMYIFASGFKYSALFATLSAALGACGAAFYISGKSGSRGWLIGAAVGGIVFCLLTLVSLTVNRGGLTQNTLFRLVIIMLSSVIGGILGVNRTSQHKYI
mgnify:CR=1 FL=1